MNKAGILKYSCFCLFILSWWNVSAHEIRPAYLEIKEQEQFEYIVKWKVPTLGGLVPDINPVFSVNARLEEYSNKFSDNHAVKYFKLNTSESIEGARLSISNLEKTLIDVIIRIDFQSGASHTLMLQRDDPQLTIPITSSDWNVIKTFTQLGISHILLGWDHLLFVLGILMIIDRNRLLLWTITAFTIAHSITLILSTLGHLSLPGVPVETIIALSVVFLAREYISKLNGETTLTIRYPWIVAFLFGLLHGFGFAGALGEIGLPTQAIPIALLTFNLGVEIGQLLFVAAILIIIGFLEKAGNLSFARPMYGSIIVQKIPSYLIGSIASFWFISRLLDIVA